MTGQPPGDDVNPLWEQLLREMFGTDADEVLQQMRERGVDPAALAAAQGLPDDPRALAPLLDQVRRLLATSGAGPVNWEVAHDLARQTAAAEGDPTPTQAESRQVTEALAVAELWLDAATDLPPAGGPVRALSRAEWVEGTLPTWHELTEPVAGSLSAALAEAMSDQLGDLGESGLAGLAGEGGLPGLPASILGGSGGADPAGLLRRLGSAVFGMQVGQAAGGLAREVFGLTDVGLPLVAGARTALLPRNVAAFAEGLDAPAEEVRLFLALREAAHMRLFTHVAWLRAHLLGAVQAYARGIRIDLDQLHEAVSSIDPTDQAALQAALSGGVFAPQTTPEQRAALVRLETALALVEGWVEEVVAVAAAPHLPHAVPLREMLRRRRAAGGPAEQTFATLVGLELRPRRSRDAAALFAQIAVAGGPAARDAVWDHPDLLPGPEDLDDPAGYADRRDRAGEEAAEVDRALAEIFGQAEDGTGPGDHAGPAGGPGDGPGPAERPGTDG